MIRVTKTEESHGSRDLLQSSRVKTKADLRILAQCHQSGPGRHDPPAPVGAQRRLPARERTTVALPRADPRCIRYSGAGVLSRRGPRIRSNREAYGELIWE